MGEALKRFREPVAWAAIAVGLLYIVKSLVTFGYEIGHDGLSLPEASVSIGGDSVPVYISILMLAAALSCVLIQPVTPKSRRILTVTAVIILAGAALELIFTVIGLFTGAVGFFKVMESLGALLSVAVKFALGWFAWQAKTRAPVPVSPPAELSPAEQQPGTPPSWRADQASGAVWARAGDAASGAAASLTAAPGQTDRGGWTPSASASEPSQAGWAPTGGQHPGGSPSGGSQSRGPQSGWPQPGGPQPGGPQPGGPQSGGARSRAPQSGQPGTTAWPPSLPVASETIVRAPGGMPAPGQQRMPSGPPPGAWTTASQAAAGEPVDRSRGDQPGQWAPAPNTAPTGSARPVDAGTGSNAAAGTGSAGTHSDSTDADSTEAGAYSDSEEFGTIIRPAPRWIPAPPGQRPGPGDDRHQ